FTCFQSPALCGSCRSSRNSPKTAFSLLSATQYDRTALDGLTPLTFASNTPKGPDLVDGIVSKICSSKIGACYLPCVRNP
ncbi:hypothetical protein HETIRDRAFT_146180, partial [Heterobasidion irregulare TC 32-1]